MAAIHEKIAQMSDGIDEINRLLIQEEEQGEANKHVLAMMLLARINLMALAQSVDTYEKLDDIYQLLLERVPNLMEART